MDPTSIASTKPHGRKQPLRAKDTEWAQKRLESGLSQRQAAELSGVRRDVISNVESGRMIPRPDEAAALLEVYRNHTATG